jgi:uncharacterized protein
VKVDLADKFDVTTAPAETFAFLTDPELFAPLLPYFKELKDVQPGAFTVGLEVGIPQVRGRVDVAVKLVESVKPERATYKSSGRHALGMVDSELAFSVVPNGEGSTVRWQSSSVVNGTLASLAQGILVPLAKRQIRLLVKTCQDRLGVPS